MYGEYLQAIKEGNKAVEVRLNDKKRRKIKVGDTIEFVNVQQQVDILKVQVLNLKKFDTFEEMYNTIPFKDFDCEGWIMKEMMDGTYQIYTPKQEKECGALVIMIEY